MTNLLLPVLSVASASWPPSILASRVGQLVTLGCADCTSSEWQLWVTGIFWRGLKKLHFGVQNHGCYYNGRQQLRTSLSLVNISLHVSLSIRAPRTIGTYHTFAFKHIHVFYIDTKAFLCCSLHPWRVTNSKNTCKWTVGEFLVV